MYSVKVRFGDLGETNDQSLQVTSSLTTTSYSGSVEGGCISLVGHGLPTEWPSKLFTVIITSLDDGISQDIEVISSTSSVLELKINAGSADKAYRVKVTDPNENILSATFTQRLASTPKAILSSPLSSITAGVSQSFQI